MLNLFQRIYLRFKNGDVVKGTKQIGGRYYSRKDFEAAKQIDWQDIKNAEHKVRAFWYPPFEGAFLKIGERKFILVPEEEFQKLGDAKAPPADNTFCAQVPPSLGHLPFTVGNHCVIGADSVVTADTEPFSIYTGVPAKKIRDLEDTVHDK